MKERNRCSRGQISARSRININLGVRMIFDSLWRGKFNTVALKRNRFGKIIEIFQTNMIKKVDI